MSIQLDDIEHEVTTEELLQLILIELRIMNAYNSLGHDETLTEEDVEEKQ